MSESLHAKLEASRKELLDLGLRNPLINYKRPKSKGLGISNEKSNSIFEILVKQGKAMSFLGTPDQKGNEIDFIEPTKEDIEASYSDTKLQTNETESSLQKKLLTIYYAAQTCIEEQGVNILYITLGMIQWFEADISIEPKQAPLILIPVELERSSARERFRVRYSQAEIGHNLSFQAKLKSEFGIDLPELPAAVEDISVEDYFSRVAGNLRGLSNWKVIPDHIELGFFSFGKFMIYHDLDNSKWPDNIKPVDHVLLQSLFNDGFKDVNIPYDDSTLIDQDTNAHQLFQVVDADSSQIITMLAVQEGKNLVVQGPPGTGKSQTITNLIANAVGQGKRVLFVAEKMAALEVVKRRMDNIGLGEACLELHSHKANKKQLHEELKRVIELGRPSIQKLEEEVKLLAKNRDDLNAYCEAVNTIVGKSGLTVHEIYGYLLKIKGEINERKLPRILIPELGEWNSEKQKAAETVAEKIQERVKHIGMPSDMTFWGTGLRVLLPHEQEALKSELGGALQALAKLNECIKRVAEDIGVEGAINRVKAENLLSLCRLASSKPDLRHLAVKDQAWVLQKNDLEEILITGKQWTGLHKEYEDVFIPEAWGQDVLEMRQHLKEHGNKWYKFLIGSYNKAKTQLKAVCKSDIPKDLESKLRYAEAILENKRLESTIKEHESLMSKLFGSRWQKLKTEWSDISRCAEYLKLLHQQVIDGTCPKAILDYLERHDQAGVASEYANELKNILDDHELCIYRLQKILLYDDSQKLNDLGFVDQQLLIEKWLTKISEIQWAISWNNLVDVVKEENLSFLSEASINWIDAKDFLKTALQKTWYEYLLEQAMQNFRALRKFETSTHEEGIKQFMYLDQLNIQYNRALVAIKHWNELPNMDAGGQVRILKGEFNRKARHMPIRKLMQEAGMAIQAIKPVFMMSPLSIANFLAPGAIEFDLVIFDEASQVRPVEAFGAILRAKQLVVVGDTKQLPPTSFFDTLNDNIDDEDNVTSDLQSILGMCDSQGALQKMLRWHYRSRHESLINLSNYEFYENRLVVFPSPGSKHRMGLVFHHLPDTFYDRGQTRTNPSEAEYVARAVMEHAKKNSKLSLGVVAFSSAQRQAIFDKLELMRRANPELEEYFKSHSDEPFFVKNLENVQGDERDVIFISIGYGKTKEGYLSMSFGPLNNDGGERRLNVLITRAKLRCEVFTNIRSFDIDLSKTQKRGVTALKSFLHYAEFGKLDLPEETGKPFESPFEESVAAELIKLGYTVRQQVGSRGFYLDLAIVDPEHPGRYILGIECDGRAYHSARSARDRDRLRQQVLENIGWRIHRVWSTDWFRNPEQELKRVVEAIAKAKEVYTLEDEIEEQCNDELIFTRESVGEQTDGIFYYKTALLTDLATQELHLHSVGRLSGWIEEIVKVESPVHFEEVARRILEAAGISRLGSRIRGLLMYAAKYAADSNKIRISGEFLWDPAMTTPVMRNRSLFPAGSKKIKYIAPQEMSLAVEQVVKDSIAIDPISAIPFIAKIFGFTRVTEEMKGEILNAIKSSISANRVKKEGELLKAV